MSGKIEMNIVYVHQYAHSCLVFCNMQTIQICQIKSWNASFLWESAILFLKRSARQALAIFCHKMAVFTQIQWG